MTAFTGTFGMPALVYLHTGTVPAVGQAAVGGTALLAAVGSTVLLNFCVSPYVHTIKQREGPCLPDPLDDDGKTQKLTQKQTQYEAVTANMLGQVRYIPLPFL